MFVSKRPFNSIFLSEVDNELITFGILNTDNLTAKSIIMLLRVFPSHVNIKSSNLFTARQ